MPSIDYDPSRVALYTAGDRDSVFLSGTYSTALRAVCAECARLAYVGFERDPQEKIRLIRSLAAGGLQGFVEILDAESRKRELGKRDQRRGLIDGLGKQTPGFSQESSSAPRCLRIVG